MTTSTATPFFNENRLLAALPAEEYQRLLPHLEAVELRLGDVLSEPDEPMRYVYFPHRGTLSVLAIMEDGAEVEVGIIGNEGMSGLPIVLGADSTPLQLIVQVAHNATRIRADVFREELKRCGQFYKLLLRYGQALLVQTAQLAACNRLHTLDERLARWLLMCQDLARANELELTHDFLSVMLGVRRAGVSVAASKLQAEGSISYTRGRIRIVDRQGLEAASCECYAVIRKEFERLSATLH
jgi:CRP-like cAMP-binding protein